MTYQVIETIEIDDMVGQVNALLASGWTCLGGIQYEDGGYLQSMTKVNQ